MCFSVTASFTASLVLLTCGVAALTYVRGKRLIMIAAIPLIFGLQQCAEGFVWLSFLHAYFEPIRMIAAYIFLACAGIIWPLWIPLAIARFEDMHNYKKYLPSLVAGSICACMSIVYALLYPIVVQANCNIMYKFDVTHGVYNTLNVYIGGAMLLCYAIATILPLFIARHKILWFIGALTAVAYIISYVAYFQAFTSVWCFFEALISLLIGVFIYDEEYRRA